MGRLIQLVIIVALAWLVWRLIKTTLSGRSPKAPRQGASSHPEKMVRCAQCGVHVPEGEAFVHQRLSFCSQDHQRDYLENHRN